MTGMRVAFMDLESSGVEPGSFPLEVGWAFCEREFAGDSFLVAPHASWDTSTGYARHIHGISIEECEASGVAVRDACSRLNGVFAGTTVYSDAPKMDGYWLRRLYEAAGMTMEFAMGDAFEVMATVMGGIGEGDDERDALFYGILEMVKLAYPHPHRARPDAVSLAATCLALADPSFMEEVVNALPLDMAEGSPALD